MNIDVHQHIIPETYLQAVRSDPEAMGAILEGERIRLKQGGTFTPDEALTSLDRYIRQMDAARLDIGVLSVFPSLMGYAYPMEMGVRISSTINDGLAAIAAAYPSRVVPMGNVPLQDPKAAVAELERGRFPAVQIASNVNGRNLDDPELLPFFLVAERLGTFIFIHPYQFNIIGQNRLGNYYLTNLLGLPTETAVAAASLMFGGVFDACPNLKVCLAHAGGSVPYIVGRWEHGQEVRPEGKVRTRTPISALMKKFYFDCISHSPSALRFLVQEVGAERVVIGTDYPFDMADMNPVGNVEALGLPDAQMQRILGGTAAGLLGLVR